MPETKEQRELRRASSAWLTKKINSVDFYDNFGSAVRREVLEALAALDKRLREIDEKLRKSYYVKPDKRLIYFYMKGGNAFECVQSPDGDNTTKKGGGDSDWDTQIAIDPWAPIPLQKIIYGLVEEIVVDELKKAGQRIASKAPTYSFSGRGSFIDAIQEAWLSERGNPPLNASDYELVYEDPQTIRKIYDRDLLGLLTNTQQPLCEKNDANPVLWPGIVLSNAIKLFDIYRLGYIWHLQRSSDKSLSEKPLLMELIDVTIPRRDTIEAVSIWKELEGKAIQISQNIVSVIWQKPDGTKEGIFRNLPLPDIDYHLREQLTMMCEVADGSSQHEDKIIKRFKRFDIIYKLQRTESRAQRTESRAQGILTDFVGVENLAEQDKPQRQGDVYDVLNLYARQADRLPFGKYLEGTEPTCESYGLALKMMVLVNNKTGELIDCNRENGKPTPTAVKKIKDARADFARTFYCTLLLKLLGNPTALDAAYSDDLALTDQLLENAYLDVSKLHILGIDQALVIRIKNYDQLQMIIGYVLDYFSHPVNDLVAKCSVRHKFHQTTRRDSITHECLLVIFYKKGPIAFLTLTTATNQDLPFLNSPVEETNPVPYCPLAEIGRQRKVAAALIDNYIIKTAISKQYEMIKEVVTP